MRKKLLRCILVVGVILLLPISAMANDGVEINETNFPDSSFRSYISTNFDDGDGVLSTEEIANATRISSENIKDLTGVEYFTNLEILSVPYHINNAELDLSSNVELVELELLCGWITEIDLSKCVNLEIVKCTYGTDTLETILWPDTDTVKYIDIQQCWYVDELDVTGYENLEYLDCHNVSIEKLDLTNCLELSELYCYWTSISELDVSNCLKLKTLDCSYTSIAEFNLINNNLLEYIWVGCSSVTKIAYLPEVSSELDDFICWIADDMDVYYLEKSGVWYEEHFADYSEEIDEGALVRFCAVTEDDDMYKLWYPSDTVDANVADNVATATISINEKNMLNGETASVNIDTGSEAVDKVDVVIDMETIVDATIFGVSDIEIETDDISISLAKDVLESLVGEYSGTSYSEMILHVEKVDTSMFAQDIQKIVGERPVFELTAEIGGNAITEFGGIVTISIPYVLADSESSEDIVVYYIDENGDLIEMSTTYDATSETVSFTTDHFSTYAIGSKNIESVLLGDVNGDDTVNVTDVMMMYKHINEVDVLTDEQFARADVNADNIVNVTDVMMIYKHINEVEVLQ